jgi:hypothetical protein
MYADCEAGPNEPTLAAGGAVQMSAVLGYAALIYSEVNQFEATHLRGTIDTSVGASDRHYFAEPSEMLTRGLPVAANAAASNPDRAQTRARDLIAELSEINTQIHQIMFQVEKAVSRLATSG